jgi:preprotein translocase subunit SecA
MNQTEEPLAFHELYFAEEPAGQLERAYVLLGGLENLQVEKTAELNRLRISYSLRDYSLEGLEAALKKAGFSLKENLLDKLGKKFIYYCEEVKYHNLNTPEHLTKSNTPVIFAKLYENHPHGDHDDTPKELRENK